MSNVVIPKHEDLSVNAVLLNVFHDGNKPCRKYKVIFHQSTLVWDNYKPPHDQHTVKLEDVISIHHNHTKVKGPNLEGILDPNAFSIHYAERGKANTWKYKSLVLASAEPLQVALWVKTLQNCLQKLTKHRPRKVLLFVNPFGGKRNALKIYERQAKPLFMLAGIDVTVNVSQRKDQIKDFIMGHDLGMYDSLACVGGDGTVSEMFNGLVLKECKTLGIDPDCLTSDLPKPRIPVGIIPGGSTDAIVNCIHGTIDVTTCVLHIIFGDTIGLDLVSTHDEHQLLRLYASAMSYGYLGDVTFHSDTLRWMGPKRYIYSGFKNMMSNKPYRGEIAFEVVEMDTSVKCSDNCTKCRTRNNNEGKSEGGGDIGGDLREWRTITGAFFMITGANISCACAQTPNGIAPYAHLGDGHLHLILVWHTSVLNNIRLFLSLANKRQSAENLPFVKVFCTREFAFRSYDVPGRWNCDGELQSVTNIRAKVHCQLLNILSRGNPVNVDDELGCCAS